MIGMLLVLPSFARDFTYKYEGKTLTYTVIDEQAKTCKTKSGGTYKAGNVVSGSLIIPSVAKDGETQYTVTELGENAFYSCSNLASVIIPNSVTKIEYSAFRDCTSLISVEIPNSVTSIRLGAFYGCSRLTSVAIPTSVTSIDEDTFYGCSSLTSVALPPP